MVATCFVPGCKNRHKKDAGIHFFRFPFKRPDVLNKWTEALKRKNFVPKPHHFVCNVHFKKEDFFHNPGSYRKLLKEQAVPSIFPWNSKGESKKVSICKTFSAVSLSGTLSTSQLHTLVPTSEVILSTSDNVKKDKLFCSEDKAVQTNPVMCLEQHVQTIAGDQPKSTLEYKKEIKTVAQKLRRRNHRIKYLTNLLKNKIKKLSETGLVDACLQAMLQEYFPSLLEGDMPSSATCSPQSASPPLYAQVVTSISTDQSDNMYLLSVDSVSSSAPSSDSLFVLSVEPVPSAAPQEDNFVALPNSYSSTASVASQSKPNIIPEQHRLLPELLPKVLMG